jgi:hypothetical protein
MGRGVFTAPRGRAPLAAWIAFAAALVLQVAANALAVRPPARASMLPAAPPAAIVHAAAFGEDQVLAYAVCLHLQSFDDQPGTGLAFRNLDYSRIEGWLERASTLAPRSAYPLLMASHLYAQVPDPDRARVMLDFVHRAFLADPARRWRWLAHAAVVAKHRLHDTPLALRYAREIAARAPEARGWARQMPIFLLEDLGEAEEAKLLLGDLLASGEVTDPSEIRFLTGRLRALETTSAR